MLLLNLDVTNICGWFRAISAGVIVDGSDDEILSANNDDDTACSGCGDGMANSLVLGLKIARMLQKPCPKELVVPTQNHDHGMPKPH